MFRPFQTRSENVSYDKMQSKGLMENLLNRM